MGKITVRRNFGSGGALTSYGHRRHKTLVANMKKLEKEEGLDMKGKPVGSKDATGRERIAELLSFLIYVVESEEYDFTEWEEDFLNNVECRVKGHGCITAKQEEVLRRIIAKVTAGKAYKAAYEKEKAENGPLYVSFL